MLLRVDSINTFYGNLHALWDVSVCLEEGEIVSLIGNNGAGKSTLMRTIMGLIRPRSGKIIYKDEEIQGKVTNKRA